MTLFDVFKKVPTFKCKSGCSDCCLDNLAVKVYADGMLSFQGNWFRIGKISAEGIKKCHRSSEAGCASYKTRGFLCRLYGASEMFPDCPHGCGAKKKLTVEETKEIIRYCSQHNLLDCPLPED